MKHALLVLAVLLAAVTTCLAGPEIGKTQIGGDFWFRYHVDRSDESTQRSGFAVERGYIGLSYGWSPDVSGQMTINVFSSSSDQGLTGWEFELRDAYLNLGGFVPYGKIRVGLQKNYFGTVHDWKYMTVRRSLADAVGVVEERDYGIAFLGMVPGGMGEWAIGVMNGEGYSSGFTPDYADKQPGVMGTLRYMPMRETVVGVSFLWDKRFVYPWVWESGVQPYESDIGYESRTGFSLMGRVGSGPFSLMGEYLYYDYPIPDRDDPSKPVNVVGTGFSVFPMVRVTEKLDLVGRYDLWDPDSDSDRSIWEPAGSGGGGTMVAWDETPVPWWVPSDYDAQYYYVKHNVYTVGFNYNITDRIEGKPGVIFQFNWQRMSPDEKISDTALEDVDSFIFQFRWGWGGLDF